MKRLGLGIGLALCAACLLHGQPLMRVGHGVGLEFLQPLVRAIYAELGYRVEFTLMPGERSLVETNKGNFDAELVRGSEVLGPYAQLVTSKETLIEGSIQAWVRKGSPIRIATPEDLKAYRVGAVIGVKTVEALLSTLGIEPEQSASFENLALMLDAGRFDVALATTVNPLEDLKRVGFVAGTVLQKLRGVHVFHQRHRDLVPRWDAALKAMKADGRYQKLLNQKE